jgi:glutathione S-transferase
MTQNQTFNASASRPIIWGRLNSFNVQKVLFLCEELGIDFDRIDAGMAYGVNKTEDYLKMNPNGLVPTLNHQGFILWESHTILRYLARTFDAAGVWYGFEPQKMSGVDQWLDWTNTTAWPPMRTLFWGWVRLEPKERDLQELELSRLHMIKLFEIMDQQLSQSTFIAGETMSLADIPLALMAYRWFNIPIERPVFSHVNAWYSKMSQSRGFKKYSSDPLS